MCGRFTIAVTSEMIKESLGIEVPHSIHLPLYNVAPNQISPIVTSFEQKTAIAGRWGFIPKFSSEEKTGYKMINARAETVMEKPAYKDAFESQRCLAIADGFYEWSKNKDPYRIVLKKREPFFFAGICSQWKEIMTFSIITVRSNELVAKLHDRMPAIFSKEEGKEFLESAKEKALEMIRPYPSERMGSYKVSKKVNKPANDTPELIEEIKTTSLKDYT